MPRRSQATIAAAVAALALGISSPAPGLHAQAAPPSCPTSVDGAAPTRPGASNPTPEQLSQTTARVMADPSILSVAEPENFGTARYRLSDYAECTGSGAGCYWSDIDAQSQRAQHELDRLLLEHRATSPEQAKSQKLALILDIDETSLTNFCEARREDYGFLYKPWNEWAVSPAAAMPIAGTLRLFTRAQSAGVAVFFITGRPFEQTDSTARNLRLAGFPNWQGLILRSPEERNLPTIQYKSAARARIKAQGYTLLLSIGDQWSDLLGAPAAEVSVKLPNPFYYIP